MADDIETPNQFASTIIAGHLQAEWLIEQRDAAIREQERAASEGLRPYDELRRQRISVGLAQQGLRMARAACEALGLPFEETAPVDLTERITELLSIEEQRTQTLTQGTERADLETQWLTVLEALPQPIEKPPGWTAAEAVSDLAADLQEARLHIAELEAQLAAAREEALREAFGVIVEAFQGEAHERHPALFRAYCAIADKLVPLATPQQPSRAEPEKEESNAD